MCVACGAATAACILIQSGAGYGEDGAAFSVSQTADSGACCQACYTNASCLYWDFQVSTRTCRLKGNQAGAIPAGWQIPGFWPNADRVAGAKRGTCAWLQTKRKHWLEPQPDRP
jgi:hypothetical protein